MDTGNKFTGHMKRTKLIVFIATRGTKAAFTTKGNKFKFAAIVTGIHGATIRRVTTMNHLVDIFDDSRTRMKLVNDMFIVVGKNGL